MIMAFTYIYFYSNLPSPDIWNMSCLKSSSTLCLSAERGSIKTSNDHFGLRVSLGDTLDTGDGWRAWKLYKQQARSRTKHKNTTCKIKDSTGKINIYPQCWQMVDKCVQFFLYLFSSMRLPGGNGRGPPHVLGAPAQPLPSSGLESPAPAPSGSLQLDSLLPPAEHGSVLSAQCASSQ